MQPFMPQLQYFANCAPFYIELLRDLLLPEAGIIRLELTDLLPVYIVETLLLMLDARGNIGGDTQCWEC